MLDRAARSTVRNFSTLFLVCMVVFLPLEMGYAFVHHDAIQVREVVPFIEDLSGRQKVDGVGRAELDEAERNRAILTGIELAFIPLLISAGRRVIEHDREEGLPTATDAWTRGLAPPRLAPFPAARNLGAIGLAAMFALMVGFVAYQAGRIPAELFPERSSVVMLGGAEAIARSVGLPWFLVAWVEAGVRARRSEPSKPRLSPFEGGGR